MIDTLTRAYLLFGALMYAIIGVAGLVAPASLLGLVEISLETPSSANEVRAFFGAQSLVLAAVFAFGALRDHWRRPALGLFVALALSFAVARVVSMVIDGMPGTPNLVLLGMEAVGTVAGILLLHLDRRRVSRSG